MKKFFVSLVSLGSFWGLMHAQNGATVLQEVFKAHGVTDAVPQAQVLFQGRYITTQQGKEVQYPLLIKTRGYAEVRFEVSGAGGARISGQFRGFRWSQKGSDKVRDYDGRYSLNLPFMDSPSTGLLAYLLANQQRIVWLGSASGTLDGIPVVQLKLQVPDADDGRRKIGFAYDRQYELLIDPASHRLLAASVIPIKNDQADVEMFRYGSYIPKNGGLFAMRVARSSRAMGGRFAEQLGSVLDINTVVSNQQFSDSDFRRPAK